MLPGLLSTIHIAVWLMVAIVVVTGYPGHAQTVQGLGGVLSPTCHPVNASENCRTN